MSVPAIGNTLFRLFVTSVFSATAAELAEFQPIRRSLLILGRHVVSTFAILTLKHNIIAWHNLIRSLSVVSCPLSVVEASLAAQLTTGNGPLTIQSLPIPCRLQPCDHLHE